MSFYESTMYHHTLSTQHSYKSRPDEIRVPHVPSLNRRDLVVKPSSIRGAGRGVFTGATAVCRGSILSQYMGWYDDEYGNFSSYNFGGIAGDPRVTDSSRGVAQLRNDAANIPSSVLRSKADLQKALLEYQESSAKCNVYLVERCGAFVAVAATDIGPGTELFFHYGEEYWIGELHKHAFSCHDIWLVRCIEDLVDQADSTVQLLRLEFDKRGNPKLLHHRSSKHASDDDCYRLIRHAFGGLSKWECDEIIACDFAGGILKGWRCESPYRRLLVETILNTACVYIVACVMGIRLGRDCGYGDCNSKEAMECKHFPSAIFAATPSMMLLPQQHAGDRARLAGLYLVPVDPQTMRSSSWTAHHIL